MEWKIWNPKDKPNRLWGITDEEGEKIVNVLIKKFSQKTSYCKTIEEYFDEINKLIQNKPTIDKTTNSVTN